VSKILVVALLHLSFTSPVTMAKGSGQGLSLLPPRLQTIGDPEKVWMWPDWTTPAPTVGVHVGSAPLMDQQPNEVVFFTAYALMDLAFPSSSFFLLVLVMYGLQMAHLLSHSVPMVAIFVHLCEMFLCVHPSLELFHQFFIL
jgi:hypothetical protein